MTFSNTPLSCHDCRTPQALVIAANSASIRCAAEIASRARPWKLAVIVWVLIGAGCGHEGPAAPAVENSSKSNQAITSVTHNFQIVDAEGRTHRPLDDESVKAVAMIFLVSDCPIANSYVPELNRLYADYEPRGIRLFVVQTDPEMTVDAARIYAQEYQLRPALVLDRDHEWVKRTGVKISPEAAVLSPAGELLYIGRIDDRYTGFGQRREQVTVSDLRQALDEILAEQPVSHPRVKAVGCDIPESDS